MAIFKTSRVSHNQHRLAYERLVTRGGRGRRPLARRARAPRTTSPSPMPCSRAAFFASFRAARSTHVVNGTGSSTMRGLPAPTLRPPRGDIGDLPHVGTDCLVENHLGPDPGLRSDEPYQPRARAGERVQIGGLTPRLEGRCSPSGSRVRFLLPVGTLRTGRAFLASRSAEPWAASLPSSRRKLPHLPHKTLPSTAAILLLAMCLDRCRANCGTRESVVRGRHDKNGAR